MEPSVWLLDRLRFSWWNEWTHSDVWSQLATTRHCSITIRYWQSEKRQRNSHGRALSTATRCIGAEPRVFCHLSIFDGYGWAGPPGQSHSARTEMLFANACLLLLPPQPVTILEHNGPKLSHRLPDMRIHILLSPGIMLSSRIHLTRIASTIAIMIQIC